MYQWLLTIQSYRHLVLLVSIFVMFFAQLVVHGFVGGQIIYDILVTIVMMIVLFVVFQRKHERYWALAIAVPGILTRWGAHGVPADYQWMVHLGHQALIVIFFAFAVGVILRGIYAERVITVDHLVGTVCGYILAGAAFGNCYQITEFMLPGSFDIVPRAAWQLQHEHSRSFLFTSFSLATMTGATFNDMTPIRPAMGSLVWMEVLFGQFYLAVVVAQLVSLKLTQVAEPVEEP